MLTISVPLRANPGASEATAKQCVASSPTRLRL
jgi:hypothetical protein